MRILRVDHVGIAVEDLEAAAEVLSLLFPGHQAHVEEVPQQGVRTTSYPAGETALEFLESIADEGPVGRYLKKRGNGIHHIALQVDDLEEALSELEKRGIPLIDRKLRPGAGGKRIAFLHPRGTGGILIELCQSPPAIER